MASVCGPVTETAAFAMLVLSLGMLYRQRQLNGSKRDDDGEGVGPDADQSPMDEFAAIAEASKGLAVTVVPLIAQLSKKAQV